MTSSTNAYIVGMTDKVRDDVIGSLEQTGYRVSQTDANMRVLSRTGRWHNQPDLVVIDVSDMTPTSARGLAEAQKELPGDKIVLVGRRASLAIKGNSLPDGPWGLVPKTISARSLEELVEFLAGPKGRLAVH